MRLRREVDWRMHKHRHTDIVQACLNTRVCVVLQARRALVDRQKDLEVKTQQLEIKLSNKTEEDIKKARRKSTQAGESPHALNRLDLTKQTR